MSNIRPKLTSLHQVTVREYNNATASLAYTFYTPGKGMPVPHDLGIVDQPAKMPFRPSELLVMAACEWLARDLGKDFGGSL